ncbi:MAG TPA: hypothetical protein VI094_16055 [Propionibacteriaceae bacterium]|jgi:hypothetical protein
MGPLIATTAEVADMLRVGCTRVPAARGAPAGVDQDRPLAARTGRVYRRVATSRAAVEVVEASTEGSGESATWPAKETGDVLSA